eukprot:3553106-Alexandrium_andersonii.AAC.1
MVTVAVGLEELARPAGPGRSEWTVAVGGNLTERYAAFGAAVEAHWAERSVQPVRGSRAQGLTFRRRKLLPEQAPGQVR